MDRWLIPVDLHLDRGGIRWDAQKTRRKLVTASSDLLDRFTELAEAEDQAIYDFACRWGPLLICEHRVPVSHNPQIAGHSRLLGPVARVGCALLGENGHGESVRYWRSLARQAKAIRQLAEALRDERQGQVSDWRALIRVRRARPIKRAVVSGKYTYVFGRRLSRSENEREARSPQLNTEQLLSDLTMTELRERGGGNAVRQQRIWTLRARLADILSEWLWLADVRPRCYWGRGCATFAVDGTSLFGTLAIELLKNVCQIGTTAVCSECGRTYRPKKAPSRSRRNYCPKCRKHAGPKWASRRQREKRARAAGRVPGIVGRPRKASRIL